MHCTTLTSVAAVIWRTLEAYRIDPKALFQEVGLDAELLNDANARYPADKVQALWSIAAERTEDPCFGLKTAYFWNPTSLHALGYAWMASSTLSDGLQRIQRYVHMVASATELALEEENGCLAVRYVNKTRKESFVDPSMDAGLTLLLELCRLLLGRDYAPASVEFMREEPDCRQRYYALFKAPVVFGAPANRLLIKCEDLHVPLPGANAELARVNEQVIRDYLARFDQMDLAMMVRAKLVEQMPTGHVTEEKIAQALNMSVRSLQRRLREEGTGFKQILDAMRQDLATDYVAASGYSVNEIAYLLGFSEPGNFTRAFKRWYGVPPSQYRVDAWQAPRSNSRPSP